MLSFFFSVAAALFVCAITLVHGQEIELNKNGCPVDYTHEKLYPHEICNKFYQCKHGDLVEHRCAADLLFNVDKQECDWPHDTDCGHRLPPDSEENKISKEENSGEDDNGDNGGGSNENGNDTGTCNCNPGEAPSICAGSGSEGVLIAHENCNQFYKCANSVPVAQSCPGNLLYNPKTETCDWPNNVDCGDRVNPECDDDSNNNGEDGSGGNGSGDNNGDNGDGSNENENDTGTCNCNPGEAPSICAGSGSEGVLIAHENCNQFYKCANGVPVALSCPGNLLYNPKIETCDWPDNVACGDRVIPECDDDSNNNGEDGSGGNGSGDNNGENGSGGNGSGDNNGDNGDGSNENENDTGTCNCNPGEAPSICAGSGSEGVLIAHENCNQFYKCANGIPVALSCPGNLLYNPKIETCDWPDNVACGDRVIPECDDDSNNNGEDGSGGNGSGDNNGENGSGGNGSGDNNGDNGNGSNENENDTGTCNCNPGEAPSICAGSGSEGVLIAHENCNQFYKCANGIPVALSCPGNLLYNPKIETCDWPDNVACGDRVIPECDDDSNNNGEDGSGGNGSGDNNGENGSGGNGSGDNNGDNGDGSNENENDTGTCNCNPGEAPSICAGSGSEGVLIAHENCNQFYKCANGVPVALSCPGNLLYNPKIEICDWPDNVACGDRVIPECDDDSNNNGEDGSGGNGSGDNNGENGSGGNGSGDNNGDNGDGSNENENDTGTCNCNPGEAPSICAGSGSEGVLIAHENCNQFYKCANGFPVALSCPGNLLYNPKTEICDWPDNVTCGDRVIPECDDDSNNNGEDGSGGNGSGDNNGENGSGGNGSGDNNGDNGNGSNENENDTGTCNCNPGEAPSICAGSGSEGVLITHENCNQFYKCANGVPVALSCPGNLLYNPNIETCDWPDNVACGDRVIPECDDDSNNNGEDGSGGNGSGDNNGENGSGGNGSGDNNGDNGNGSNENENDTGTCNCNPGEAPSICAGSGSEGVLIAHENCNQFYKCANGVPVALSCPGGLLYNPFAQICDWPANVACGDRVIPEGNDDSNNNGENGSGGNGSGDSNGENGSGGNDSGDNDGDNGGGDNRNGNDTGTCNCNPGEAPSICAGSGSEGVLIAHENCNQFYQCCNGVPVALICPSGLLYNPFAQICDWPANVPCGDRVIPEGNDDSDNNGENGSGGNGSGDSNGENGSGGNGSGDNNGDNGSGDNGNGNDTGTCNCNPGEAPSICAGSGSEGVLIAHENCNQFYQCANGVPVALSCPGGLLYNPFAQICDWPANVACGDRVIPEGNDDSNNNGENGSGGNGSGDSNGENGSGGNDSGDNDGDNGGGDNGNGNDTGTCNCNPGEAPSICASSGSEGVLIAHENCNQFYQCCNGVPVALSCPSGLLYNPFAQICDWPANVACGDRVIPEGNGDSDNNGENGSGGNGSGDSNGENGSGGNGSGDNNGDNGSGDNGNGNDTGTCNCNPGEAPSICAGSGSEGVLIAHENCNQFYKCANGVPVALSCPGGLLYNPFAQICDWPANVACGDRVIPEGNDDSNNNGENGSGGNGSGDNNGENGSGGNGSGDNNGDNGGEDNGNGNDTGTCNCNPGEAPSICAGSGSEGVLIAHENCNQFYQCCNGVPVALSCPSGLLYNPFAQICDWPANVACGDRVIPEGNGDSDNNGENGSGGNGSGDSNGENGSGDNGSGDNNGDNGSGDNGNGNDTSTCNCNPGDAPSICAGSGSEGVLIAHENCNQFYQCANGVPVALSCSGGLLYNPFAQICDWPANVACGDRVIPEGNGDSDNNGENGSGGNGSGDSNGENGSGGNGSGDNNGDNGGGDNGNGNDTGTCNCNPGEAPSICAVSGSEGVLIAHENCNQFYQCANGVPVALSCSGGLLYNPFAQICDWPANVACGDRVIPEGNGDSNNNGENGSGGNGSGDNNGGGSNENGNDTGTCNCNPDEAPSICAGSGSEGVLIAHENCNQFYKCANGVPVALSCPGGLLYHPWAQICDWPNSVNCSDRVIPDGNNNNNVDNGSENNNGGNEEEVNGPDDNNSNEEDCDGVEILEVCQAEGSDGVFVAHENCNQFYVCSEKQATVLDCPGDLLYNAVSHRCELSVLVDCGDRNIIEAEDNGNNNGDCNCNPRQAPLICAHEGSEGELIAHENCDQFYKCANGIPVTFSCAANLFYNPYKQFCDWPQNVDCEGKGLSYFVSMNKHLNGRKLQVSNF